MLGGERIDAVDILFATNLPRSLILKTPETVLLVRRCLIFDSVGEASPCSMAESTLDRGIWISVDMIGKDGWFGFAKAE